LKGPQGAIYGRNATAGAIVVSTVKPGDVLKGTMKLSYANGKTIEGSAYISSPLGDNAGFVLSGNYRSTDGFYRNLYLGRKVVDDQEVYPIDGRFMAQLGDATELDVKARQSQT